MFLDIYLRKLEDVEILTGLLGWLKDTCIVNITSCSILSGHRPVKIRRAAIVGAENETLCTCIYDFICKFAAG